MGWVTIIHRSHYVYSVWGTFTSIRIALVHLHWVKWIFKQMTSKISFYVGWLICFSFCSHWAHFCTSFVFVIGRTKLKILASNNEKIDLPINKYFICLKLIVLTAHSQPNKSSWTGFRLQPECVALCEFAILNSLYLWINRLMNASKTLLLLRRFIRLL